MKCARNQDLLRHLAGSLSPERAAALEEHLTHCPHCKQSHDQIVAATGRLAADPGEFDGPEIAKDVMTLIRMGRTSLEPAQPKRFRPIWMLVPAAAGALALLLVLAWPHTGPDSDGFQIRGSGEDPDRWVSVKAFRSGQEGYQALDDQLQSNDSLAFSYRNLSQCYHHLMVFAVDQEGQVFWYYPAHSQQGINPASIAIDSEAKDVPLPDQVQHPLRPGSLRLFALFSAEPLRVNAVETAVAQDLLTAESLLHWQRINIPDTGQHSILWTVIGEP